MRFIQLILLISGLWIVLLTGVYITGRGAAVSPYIAFLSDRDGNSELYLMRVDGRGVEQITFTEGRQQRGGRGTVHCWFRWQDATRLVTLRDTDSYGFGCFAGQASYLVQVNTTARSENRLEGLPPYILPRELSAESGQMMLTVSEDSTGPFVYHIADVRQNTLTPQPLPLTRSRVYDNTPAWSPDGDWLAFFGNPVDGYEQELYRMRPDGTDIQQLTHLRETGRRIGVLHPFQMIWTPDSQQIVFMVQQITERGIEISIARIDADGRNLTDLTTIDQVEILDATMLLVSPDGQWVYFLASQCEGQYGLCRVPLAGGPAEHLHETVFQRYILHFDFAPEGDWLVYSNQVDGRFQLFRMNTDGSAHQRLASGPGDARFPFISPPVELPFRAWPLLLFAAGITGAALLMRYVRGRQRSSPRENASPGVPGETRYSAGAGASE